MVRLGPSLGALVLAVLWLPVATATQDDRPELTLRASPQVAFATAEISFSGVLRGGADDYEGFDCVSAGGDARAGADEYDATARLGGREAHGAVGAGEQADADDGCVRSERPASQSWSPGFALKGVSP